MWSVMCSTSGSTTGRHKIRANSVIFARYLFERFVLKKKTLACLSAKKRAELIKIEFYFIMAGLLQKDLIKTYFDQI
jgi:hypothetical protein